MLGLPKASSHQDMWKESSIQDGHHTVGKFRPKIQEKNSQMVSFHDSGFRILSSIPTTKVLKPLTFYRYIYITFIFQKKQTSIHLNVVA